MAENKQKVILLHGERQLTENNIGLVKGQVAVYNAAQAKDAEIYATLSDDTLVSFPSKAYVNSEISAVTKALGEHASDIAALELTVNGGTDGEGEEVAGLANRLADVEASLGLDSGEGSDSISSRLSDAENDIAALELTVNGGTDSEGKEVAGLVSTVSAHTTSLAGMSTSIETLNGDADTAGSVAKAVKDAKDAIESKTINGYDLSNSAIIVNADDVPVATISDYTGKTVQDILEEVISKKNTDDANLADWKGVIEATLGECFYNADGEVEITVCDAIAKATSEVKGEGQIKVTKTTGATDGHAIYTVETSESLATSSELNGVATNLASTTAIVESLIGDDKPTEGEKQKSIREIANDELAKQLIAEGAAESLNTLQEIAQWIQDHPGDAAAMNTEIANLKSALSGYITLDEDGEVTVKTVSSDIAEINSRKIVINGQEFEVANNNYDLSTMVIDCGTYE